MYNLVKHKIEKNIGFLSQKNKWVSMPSHSQQWRLDPWNCSRPAPQVLHTNAAPNCFYPALSGCFVVKCTFSLLFFFSAHHVSSSVLTTCE